MAKKKKLSNDEIIEHISVLVESGSEIETACNSISVDMNELRSLLSENPKYIARLRKAKADVRIRLSSAAIQHAERNGRLALDILERFEDREGSQWRRPESSQLQTPIIINMPKLQDTSYNMPQLTNTNNSTPIGAQDAEIVNNSEEKPNKPNYDFSDLF